MIENAVLFDLDGTLTDSRPGIVGGLRHALRALGHPIDETDDLTWAIGPPTEDVFARLLAPFGDSRVAEGVALYRARYDAVGWRENAPYAGIDAMLQQFAATGWPLFVATSKRVDFAQRILDHFGFAQYFTAIHGAGLDGAHAQKAELIAHVVRLHGIDARRAVMIGDRFYDIAGAHANDMRAIGVTWGYGTREELERAGADALAEGPEALLPLVEKGK